MATKTALTLSTIERLFDDVDEWYVRVRKIRQKLSRLRQGSVAYLDLLPDLLVEVEVLKRKAELAAQALEEYEDSLPEGD